jgi:hypothetical protein
MHATFNKTQTSRTKEVELLVEQQTIEDITNSALKKRKNQMYKLEKQV